MRKTVWILLFSLLLSLCACGEPASDNWEGFDLSKGAQLNHLDTRGGFHSDGIEFSAWQFSADYGAERTKALEASSGWSPLPLTETLHSAVYGTDAGAAVSYGSCLTDEEGNALFPVVTHGYYYFYDRNSESTDPKDDTDLLSRYSLNFTFAIFDTDKSLLYYSTLDT